MTITRRAIPGDAARNGLLAGRLYLSRNQREMLAVLVSRYRLTRGDLEPLLGRDLDGTPYLRQPRRVRDARRL